MDILLDSHPILWSMYGPEKLSDCAAELIADKRNRLFTSLGTIIEISHKAAFHKLPLVGNDVRPILRQLDEYGCTIRPILKDEILAAVALPLINGDPFDRLYVAPARSRRLTILTKDPRIVNYDVPTIW